MKYAIIFSYALVFGSFYTVLAFDQSLRSIKGRSQCDRCGSVLSFRELIPVFSYLVQGGKCRSCQEKISFIYPLAEVVTASLAIVLLFQFGWTRHFAFYSVLFSLLIMLTLSDLETMRVPNRLLIIFTPLLVLLSPISYKEMLLGFLISLAVFFLSSLFSKQIGMGDIKLLLLMGLVLGYQVNLLILCLASLLGIIYFCLSQAHRLPFVPFIALASIVVILLSPYLPIG